MAEENPRLFEKYSRDVTARLERRLEELQIATDFSDNALSVLNKRYLAKDENGVPQEDVRGLFKRVAANIAYPDCHYGNEEVAYGTAKTFYEMMAKREFMPNSPTLMNAGRAMQQLSACFVLPIDDDMRGPNGILTQVANMGKIHMSGGGTGFSFSKLRRKNDFVSTTYGKASGPVSFISMYDATTHSVNQGGFRRGANMGILKAEHADILEFIHAKENEKARRYENFNFSVGITDDFMKALEKGEHYILKNPRSGEIYDLTVEDIKRDEKSVKQGLTSHNERVLVVENGEVIYQNPEERDIRGRVTTVSRKKVGRVDSKGRITLDARIVFDEIASLAWRNGEPGIAFLDHINRYNPTPQIGEIESTNPCGEQPLLPYEACNLGSINLGLMVEDRKIDYKKLERTVKNAVHFLDNVVDMSNFPLEQITEMVHANRKIGLGVMGFADMLIKLEIPYNSEQGIATAEELMKFIQEKGGEASVEIAKKRGVFKNFYKSIYAEKEARRNAAITTIAPTGTISIISGASSGMEPLFELMYTHKDADGQIREFVNEDLKRDLEMAGIKPEKVLKELSKGKSLQEIDFVPDRIKRIYVASGDVSVEYHVRMQAAFQKYTDNAVSKTINMPNSATIEDVKKAYLLAYKLGCKGITVYRKGSREEEVLKKKGDLEEIVHYVKAKERPEELHGITVRKRTGCGNLFVVVNYEEKNGHKDMFEVFATMGKAGGCASCQNEATGRLTSFLLRSHVDPKEVASQLIGIRCNKPYGLGPNSILSCADAIGKALAESLDIKVEGEIGDSENFEDLLTAEKKETAKKINEIAKKDPSLVGGSCPNCGSVMEPKEGCIGGVCTNLTCGFSECS